MRKNILLLIMLLCATITSAQQHDNIWLFGYLSNPVDSTYGGTVLDFSSDTLNIYYEFRDMFLDVTNASICDSFGNLLFYTNGLYIANAVHEIMENGEGLNPGDYADDQAGLGYILDQGAIVLPFPSSDSLFYLFHLSKDYPTGQISFHCPKFYYSLIDISLNGGLGKVIEKNELIINDILDLGKLTATKHANGIDWWILLRKYGSSEFYSLRITPNEVLISGIQDIGSPFLQGIGQSVFSPDGNKYVVYSLNSINSGNFLNIYDFDRCSGLLSNPIQVNLIDSAYSGGVAISPNSQFLYVSSYNYIYQYDLYADDILASKDTIAIYDGYKVEISPSIQLSTRFFLMQLGPDGRIYINCPAGVNVLHVIENPDLPGEACNVIQHGIQLPTYNAFSMPNFPNYRLGALPDSACDTTSAIAEPVITPSSVAVFPNPATHQLTLEFEVAIEEEHEFTLYSVTGQQQTRHLLSEGQKSFTIGLGNTPPGLYFYKIRKNGKHFTSGKITIIKL